MRFLSCFSGIEAASVAFLPLGWECVGVAEVEPFPCAVLAHHYPDVPNLGDVTADDFLQRASALRPDVLAGGPPCQDFSIAGLRAGLEGVRGALSMRWVEIIHAVRPAFAVTENVPGWLNLHGGKAFGAFIAGLVGHDTALIPPRNCGGRWTNAGMVAGPLGRVAWRVLDAQYFALAQRRQRVFAVFCPRDGADPAALLFESKSLQGHSPPRREAGKGTSAGAVCGALPSGGTPNGHGTAGVNSQAVAAGHVIAQPVANPLGAKRDGGWRGDLGNDTYAVAFQTRGSNVDLGQDVTGTIGSNADRESGSAPCVAWSIMPQNSGRDYKARQVDVAQPVMASGPVGGNQGGDYIQNAAATRRLTPEECEALQGFPRLYTRIPYGKKGPGSGWSADGPRYRALGNSMAVPCMAWIGRRIAAQEAEAQRKQEAA